MPATRVKDAPKMPEQTTQNGAKPPETPEGITKITVGGYKSIAQEQSIEIRPLTILAGANSSGKSSIMQPLLLLKQTLEASYDPGALFLDGPIVKFSSAEQLFSQSKESSDKNIVIRIKTFPGGVLSLHFHQQRATGIAIYQMDYSIGDRHFVLRSDMTGDEVRAALEHYYPTFSRPNDELRRRIEGARWVIIRDRCFLDFGTQHGASSSQLSRYSFMMRAFGASATAFVESNLRDILYLPGLRGNPERTYPVTAVGPTYPGNFNNYVASVLTEWKSNRNSSKLKQLNVDFKRLGLTSGVTAKSINDTQVELRVGRTPSSHVRDLVSIADVGIGVSQTLPVLVALHTAKLGQLVYIEQPEIHLHPRAQTAMAQVLADAAMRGVRVVAETHSSLLLLGIQTLVAEGKLPPELVKLHWFTRGDDGATTIRSADLDKGGAFGDWPEDFGDVTLDAQDRFLDAAERHLIGA